MSLALEALVIALTYALFGGGLIAVLLQTCRPPRLRVAGLAVPDFVPSSTDTGGLV